ncbi:hypothetical protein [Micromonospora auratinigra]|uniref:Uncharacterized protein n=1 Tax=Micromonospora auratinigra TaxID=261654 RepID=A0A1A9A4H6_9ACTN|nr:hypothetical protein [Micromonospora auratinigra]SBT51011.1 hypothetical protein GA0070611_4984 [Micromonospora auratinigra]
MNGEELREALHHEMAAVVPPPPLAAADALGSARRTRARRRTGWACAGSAVAVLTVAGVALAGTTGAGTGGLKPAGPGPGPLPGPTGKATAQPWPTGPDGRPQEDRTARAGTRHDQAVRLLDEIIAVVPAGYTVPENAAGQTDDNPPRTSQAEFDDKVQGVDVWRYTSSAAVRKEDRTGRVLVEVYTRGNRLPTEPCELTRQFWGMQGDCQVVTVGGTRIGVVVRPTVDRRFEQWSAYRHPDGVVTFVAQTPTFDRPQQGLVDLPFTVPQLAALAMDERFHLQ